MRSTYLNSMTLLSAILTTMGMGALGTINVAIAGDLAPELTGKQLSYDSAKGNCLACHAMPTMADAEAAGTIGPPLLAMQARYPDRARLRAEIWNAMIANPNTVMPPFGKNLILTEQEIDKITDFVAGL